MIVGIAAIVALAILVASPHVVLLKLIAQRLGLVQSTMQYVYVLVNHTVYVNQTAARYVYVNQTVPTYINRTVYALVGLK